VKKSEVVALKRMELAVRSFSISANGERKSEAEERELHRVHGGKKHGDHGDG